MKPFRRMLAALCAVVAVLALVTAQVSRVAYRQAFDTDSFTDLAGDLVATEEIRGKITDELTAKALEDNRIGESLSARTLAKLGLTAEQVDSKVEEIVRTSVGTVLGTEAFADAWAASVRAAHTSLVAAIDDDSAPASPVSLDLSPVMSQLSTRLAAVTGVLAKVVDFAGIIPPDGEFTFEFIPADTIDDIRTAADATRALRTAGAVLALAMLAAVIFLPVRRSNGVIAAASAVAASSVIVFVARAAGRSAVENASDDNADVIRSVYDAVSGPLTAPAAVLLVLAIGTVATTTVRRRQAVGS